MHNENWVTDAGLQQYERGELANTWLLQERRHGRHSRRIIDRGYRQASAYFPFDLEDEGDGKQRIAPKIEKISVMRDRRSLQHPLPDRGQTIVHPGSIIYASSRNIIHGGPGAIEVLVTMLRAIMVASMATSVSSQLGLDRHPVQHLTAVRAGTPGPLRRGTKQNPEFFGGGGSPGHPEHPPTTPPIAPRSTVSAPFGPQCRPGKILARGLLLLPGATATVGASVGETDDPAKRGPYQWPGADAISATGRQSAELVLAPRQAASAPEVQIRNNRA